MNRFAFGRNWRLFLASLSEQQIESATASLYDWLGPLDGTSFLDIGSGSGLMSLAARRLGATVHSFDYDPESVECTRALQIRYRPGDPHWHVERGDVLDRDYLATLGQFDIVYSWGVLHHTGDMWAALENTCRLVNPRGRMMIALYNDQRWVSRYWLSVKQLYNAAPAARPLVIAAHLPTEVFARIAVRALTGRLKDARGMSYWRDMIDWLGGYPFEVAGREAVASFFEGKGLRLKRHSSAGRRHGCNEYLFVHQ